MKQQKIDLQVRKLYQDNCPQKYTGPIEAVDGTRPFNGYLWRTEWWWANREISNRHRCRFNFGIVHLAAGVAAGGDFAVDGMLWSIEKNNRRYSWTKQPGQLPKPNNFPTRTAAIRTSAADLLHLARAARGWKHVGGYDSLHDLVKFAEIVNWVRAVVARETGSCAPRVMVAKPPPPPKPERTGLELLDVMIGAV